MKLISDAWLLARKDLRVYRRDTAALCLGFLVPMALVTVFGWIMTFAFGGSSAMPAVELWVVDEDQSEASQRLVDALKKSESLKVRPRPNAPDATREKVKQLIADGAAHHAIIIPKGYSKTDHKTEPISEPSETIDDNSLGQLLLLRDPGRSMEEQLIQIALMQSAFASGDNDLWMTSLRKLFREQGMGPQSLSALDSAMEQMQATISQFIEKNEEPNDPSKRTQSSEPETQSESPVDMMAFMGGFLSVEKEDIQPPARPKQVTYQRAQSVSGMTVMMLLFGLSGAGAILLAEREMGTLKRLFGLPIARESVLLGKLMFVSIVGLSQMVVLFVFGELMFRVGMFRDPLTLAVLVITWVLAASGFGLLITTFSRSAKQADGVSTISILTMAALGGCWFPLQTMNLPLPMEMICKSMMTYWAMDGLQSMLWNGLSIFHSKVALAVGIQWIWIVSMGTLSVMFFRKNYCRDA
jgi:ABC-2 type transport system permease protein